MNTDDKKHMYFELLIDDIDMTLSELFYEAVDVAKHPEKYKKLDLNKSVDNYNKYCCLKSIYKSMWVKGYKDIDWKKAHKDGLLCLHAYYWFDEIKHLKNEGIKEYLKRGRQEIVDKLNKKYET